MSNKSKLISMCMAFLLVFGLLFTPHVQASDLDDEIFEEEEYVDYYVKGTEDDEEDDSEIAGAYSINSGEYGANIGLPIGIVLIKAKYENAKKEGKKTDKHSTYTKDQLKKGKLPLKSRKYSSHDLLNSKGKVKQRRYYDGKGRADMDIDYTDHGNPKTHPKVPHRHDWKWDGDKASRGKWY